MSEAWWEGIAKQAMLGIQETLPRGSRRVLRVPKTARPKQLYIVARLRPGQDWHAMGRALGHEAARRRLTRFVKLEGPRATIGTHVESARVSLRVVGRYRIDKDETEVMLSVLGWKR